MLKQHNLKPYVAAMPKEEKAHKEQKQRRRQQQSASSAFSGSRGRGGIHRRHSRAAQVTANAAQNAAHTSARRNVEVISDDDEVDSDDDEDEVYASTLANALAESLITQQLAAMDRFRYGDG